MFVASRHVQVHTPTCKYACVHTSQMDTSNVWFRVVPVDEVL